MEERFAGPWTHFWDMHSGGGRKLDWENIFIQAPEEEAKVIFYNRFGRNPDCVTCTCCGPDYSISESPDLYQASGYHRNCRVTETKRRPDGHYDNDDPNGGKYLEPGEAPPYGYKVEGRYQNRDGYEGVSLPDYVEKGGVEEYGRFKAAHFIFAEDIKPEERTGDIPTQGYVWVD